MQSDKPKIFFLTGRLFRQEDRLFLTGRHEDMMLGCEKNKKNVFLSSCQKTCLPVRYANIVQAVKRCYKIKIDYRDLCCCFSWVLLRY